jgi:hypothetical protein
MTPPTRAFWLAVAAYLLLSLSTVYSWRSQQINSVTGDEPHYLVIASGMAHHGTLEQTAPYQKEFRDKAIYKGGLAPADAQPSPENTHAVQGPHGLFNVHNIGLPALIAPAFGLSGILAVKWFLIALGMTPFLFAWKLGNVWWPASKYHVWACISACFSMPLIPGANQIFPDLLAGYLLLSGIYWVATIEKKRTLPTEALWIFALSFLAWLQIKYFAPAAIILVAIGYKTWQKKDRRYRLPVLMAVAGSSLLALALYNLYAFGKASGPYTKGALVLNSTSLMVFFGLFLDQNHGLLLQNPANLVGVWALPAFFKRDRFMATTWLLTLLAAITPNSLHPVWYGGFSFSGRFGWAAAMIFCAPTIYGFLKLHESHPIHARLITAILLGLQLIFFFELASGNTTPYSKALETWPSAYSMVYMQAASWLPMLYNSEWAFKYLLNYAWLGLVLSILLLGSKHRYWHRFGGFSSATAVIVILVLGYTQETPKGEAVFSFDRLLSNTGRTTTTSRQAEPRLDTAGYITYGPYFGIKSSNCKVDLYYTSSATKSKSIGHFEVFDYSSKKVIQKTSIQGTEGTPSIVSLQFSSHHPYTHSHEFRTWWSGTDPIRVERIVLTEN